MRGLTMDLTIVSPFITTQKENLFGCNTANLNAIYTNVSHYHIKDNNLIHVLNM